MQITTVALLFLAATSAAVSPIQSEPNTLDARAESAILITYHGTCTKARNECKFKNQRDRDSFVKCPFFANKKCTRDGASCSFDSVSRAVTCE